MTDADILSVLKSIDKSMKAASTTTKERPSLTRKVAGGSDRANTKDSAEASKAIRATASSARKLSSSTIGLTKSFDGLNVEVRRTISNFSSLGGQLSKLISNLQMEPMSPAAPTLNVDLGAPFKAFKGQLDKSAINISKAIDGLGARFNKSSSAIAAFHGQLTKLTSSMKDVIVKPDVVKTEVAKVDPIKTGIAQVDPVTLGPIKVDPVTLGPIKVDPVSVDPITVKPVTVDPIVVKPVSVDPIKVDPIKIDPKIDIDTTAFALFRRELNTSIGTFGMLNTRLSKLVQKISALTPDRERLTKALLDVTTKALQPLQALGKQTTHTKSQLEQLNSSLARAIDHVEKLASSSIISPDTIKGADSFGKKLGELAGATSIDPTFFKDLEEMIGVKLNPRLEELSITARELNKELAKFLKNGLDDDDREEAVGKDKAVKNAIMASKELNKSSSALAASFKAMTTELAKMNAGVKDTTGGLKDLIERLNANVQQPEGERQNNTGVLAGIASAFSGLFAKEKPRSTEAAATPSISEAIKPGADAPAAPSGGAPIKPILNTGPANKGLGGLAAGAIKGGATLMIFERIVGLAWEATKKLTRDFFKLSAVGMGSTAALYSISTAAIKSGMSVEEYTKILAENSELASRAGSIDNFDKLTSAANQQLAQLGVFGADAKALQASLLNSATLAGIPQQQFAEVMQSQVNTFDRLRKSVNMTSEEFGKLVASVSEYPQTQKELVGLAPAERAARQNQILQIAATGRSLGLSAQASQKLTDALIAQRGETVKKRFEGAGRVRQLAAMTGDAGAGEEAAQIIMKGRRATAEETERLRQIAGQLDQGAQQLQENGSFGQQAAIDTIDEALSGTAFKGIMDANRPAQLATESAAQFNKDFGQHVGEFGQAVGRIMTAFVGLEKSVLGPLVPIIATLAGGALAKMVGGGIISSIKSAMTGGGGMAKSLVTGAEAAAGTAGKFMKTLAQAPVNMIKSLTSGIGNLFTKILNFPSRIIGSIGNAFTWVSSAVTNAGTSLMKGVNLVRGAFTSASGTVTQAGGAISRGVGFLRTAWSGFTGFFSGLSSSASGIFKGLTGAFGTAFNSVGPLLKGAFRVFAWVGPLIDGVGEAFSGALTSTFTGDGDFIDRIFGVALAAFRSIPAALFGAFDSVFGTNLTNGLDVVLTTMVMGIQVIKDKFFGLLYDVVSKIPFVKDSAFGATLKGWKDKQEQDTIKTAQTLEKLIDDSGSTLNTIGKKNTEVAVAREKDTVKATTKAGEADKKLNSTTVGMITRAGVLADAKTLAGMPAQQNANTVTQSGDSKTVTTPAPQGQQATLNTSDKTATANAQKPDGSNTIDMTAQLTEMIAILRSSLEAQQRQNALGEAFVGVASSLNTKPATSFASSEAISRHLLNA